MSKNPENWWKSMKIANTDREILLDFWTTSRISMKFSRMLWLIIILGKLTSLPPTHTLPSHFRVEIAVQKNLAKLIGKHLWWSSLSLKLGNLTLQLKNPIRDFIQWILRFYQHSESYYPSKHSSWWRRIWSPSWSYIFRRRLQNAFRRLEKNFSSFSFPLYYTF